MNKRTKLIIGALCALALVGIIVGVCLLLGGQDPVDVPTVPTTTIHVHAYFDEIKTPNCTEAGYTLHTCACGFSYCDTDVPAEGHTWSQWVVVLEPTEDDEGERERGCSKCNVKEQSPVAKLPPSHKHSYTEAVTQPTCTTGGHTLFTCDCGDSYTGSETAPLGHSFTRYAPNGDATCTVDGTKTAQCDRCEEMETVTNVGSATGHQYNKKVVKPTCTEGGYSTYTCTCGDSYQDDETPAAGHIWGDWVTTQEPTEEAEGKRERKCEECWETEKGTIAKLPPTHHHNYTETVIPPTCTAAGYTVYTCDCGDRYTGADVASLGHSFTKYISNNDATCTVDGTKTAKCDRCDKTNTLPDKGSATGHQHSKQEVKPTCKEGGYTIYTCTCGDTYRGDMVAATGHTWGAWITTQEPTVEAEGKRERACSICGTKETGSIAKLPPVHVHSYWEKTVLPTCTQSGHTVYSCACGDSYIDNDVPALGHSFTNYESDQNATCTLDGTKTAKCDRCTETRTIPDPHTALGHSFGQWVTTVVPTEQADGKRERVCANCGTKEVETLVKQILSYEEYNNLTAEEQLAYYNSFGSPEAFFLWFNAAKQEYEDSKDKVDVGGDGTIDIGGTGGD